jgi:hypothetical protein
MKDHYIRLPIIATNKHCSNDCPGMSSHSSYCIYFGQTLSLDDKRIINECLRLAECKKANINHEE